MAETATRLLKRLRVSQPLNAVGTAVVRSTLRSFGCQSEFVIRHLHRVGRVRCKLPNGRTMVLWSRADDWVSNQVYWRGWAGYEPEGSRLFFALGTRAAVTFDIGAHVGYYALLAGHANPRGTVFAFEPHPEVHQRLMYNVALNRLTNVRCIPRALGAEARTTTLYYEHSAGMLSGSSLTVKLKHDVPTLGSSSVTVVTGDEFVSVNGIQRIDLMKIDTETTEPQILRGLMETLRRDRPIIFCEVLPGGDTESELEGLLAPLGYRYYMLTPSGAEPMVAIRPHPEYLNYLFVAGTVDLDGIGRF